MERWRGRVAVVTGASEGIGEAVVRRLAEAGMLVVGLARRTVLLQELERTTRPGAGGRIVGMTCDVTSRDAVTSVFSRIETELGPISVLVNNAGVLFNNPLTDLNLDQSDAVLDTNLKGVLYCSKIVLLSMKKNNITDGHIINISSIWAHLDTSDHVEYAVYASTKSALNVLSKSLKYQLSKEKSNIKVSAVSPGIVETTMTKGIMRDYPHLPSLVSEDIAQAVEYVLATPPNVNIRELVIEAV